jgi:hypothetical protein
MAGLLSSPHATGYLERLLIVVLRNIVLIKEKRQLLRLHSGVVGLIATSVRVFPAVHDPDGAVHWSLPHKSHVPTWLLNQLLSRRRMDESPFAPLGSGTLVLQSGITRFQSQEIKTREP